MTEEDLKRENEFLKLYIMNAPNLDEVNACKYVEMQNDVYYKGRKDEREKCISKFKIQELISNMKKDIQDENYSDSSSLINCSIHDTTIVVDYLEKLLKGGD